ncbi:MAG: low molecular weight protein arginine phosphatase [Clostridiales bacterium]|nr:low molecular weight protein arginine phosphatase [Clostridiales bacterium]
MKKQVLFLCAGNTCRSPMADVLFRHMLGQAGLSERFTVVSAGLSAFHGDGAAPGAEEAMRERGLDLSEHRSRPLSDGLLVGADWIVTMTQAQKRLVMQARPGFEQVVSLGEFAEGDIADPFGRDAEVYRRCAAKIEDALEKFLARLREEEK